MTTSSLWPPGSAVLSPSAHVDTFSRRGLPPAELWPTMMFDLPKLRYPIRLNSAESLLDHTIRRLGGNRPCLYDGAGAMWSYAQLADLVNRISWVLVDDLGVVSGNRILLRGPNSPWLAACWLAALKVGAVAVTTSPMLRAGELRTCAEMADVDLVLCDERYVTELERAGLENVRTITYGTGADAELAWYAVDKPAEFPAVLTAADDVALIGFTSGTTGKPKATMHFHRDVLAIADTFAEHILKPGPDDVFAGSPSLAFTFGLGGLLVFPLRAGASTVLLEKPSPDELFGRLRELGASILFSAPTAYRSALGRIDDFDFSSLRRCVSAGEALSGQTWHAFREATGHRLIDGIGSTEMLHVFVSECDSGIRPGATGRPVPGYHATILDQDGNPVEPGIAGRLAVRGPTGCRYLNDDRQLTYVQGGWNITGDTYIRDEDGYFWYQARSDDLIVSSGYNIAAPEVEEALARHADVVECGVVGVPDEARGAIVKAYVVLASGVPTTEQTAHELQDFVKQQIAPYKYPRSIEFVTELPHTHNGKLRRSELRRSA
jgi:2-aminobenzoate-CoA ligase